MENEPTQEIFEKCTFCGKRRRDVAVMLQGMNGSCICCNCVATSLKLIGEHWVSQMETMTHQKSSQSE